MAKKQLDPLKAKQQKQKKILAVLGVVFLGVAAFMGPQALEAAASAAASAARHPRERRESRCGCPHARRTDPARRAGAGCRRRPTRRARSSPRQPTVQDGQLASFSRFASKDPFSQQLSDVQSFLSSLPAAPRAEAPPIRGLPSVPGNAPAPGSAVISVNGTLYTVATKTDFPQPSATDPAVVPLFHLVSVTAHTATISIAGGSYATGAPTVTLKENKPVTLMNTADGTRYTLVLKPLGTAVSTGTATSGSGIQVAAARRRPRRRRRSPLPPATP